MIHFQQFTPNDPIAVALVILAVAGTAVTLLIANHNLKDRH